MKKTKTAGTVRLPLTGDDAALIDANDFYRAQDAGPWHRAANGYVVDGRQNLLHRFILGLSKGDGLISHHINSNRADCRRSNLTLVTRSEHRRLHSNDLLSSNRSGVAGCRLASHGRWISKIRDHGRMIWLGTYSSLADAAKARALGIRVYWNNDPTAIEPLRALRESAGTASKSGTVGVSYNKASGHWVANIGHNAKQVYLGMFEAKDDAIVARKAAELRYKVAG